MDSFLFVIIILILFSVTLISILLIIKGIASIKNYNLVRKTPTFLSVDVDKGLTEVKGTIEPLSGAYLTSPLTNVPCVQYHAKIEEEVHQGKKTYWSSVFEKRDGYCFLVRDDSGLTKIVTVGGDLHMEDSMNEVTSFFNGMSEDARIALTRLGQPTKTWMGFPKKYRLKEKVFRINSDVYVLGNASEMIMEPELERDPHVSPYTISKKDVLIVSAGGEGEVASNLIMKGVLLIGGAIFLEIVFGGIALFLIM